MSEKKNIKRLGSEERQVELELLQADERYQRQVQKHHEIIRAEFDPNAVGVLKVSRRPDGSLWLLDGLQRKTAMVKLGIKKWRCEIIDCDTLEYESLIFTLVNDKRTRKGLSMRDLFKAKLTAKDPVAIGLAELMARHGLKPALSGGAVKYPYCKPLALLYRLYGSGNGPDLLGRTFALVERMWPGEEEGIHESILGAVFLLYRLRDFDEERFVKHVGAKSPKMVRLSAEGAGASNRHAAVADRMIAIYNTKLSYGSKNALRLFADRAPKDEPEDESKEVS